MRALRVRSESKVSMRPLLAFDPRRWTIFLGGGETPAHGIPGRRDAAVARLLLQERDFVLRDLPDNPPSQR